MKNKHYTHLSDSIIIGYIDHLDVVHSQIQSTDSHLSHNDLYGKVLKGWVWSFRRNIEFSIYARGLTLEDYDLVRRHLSKKYKIQFYDNGHYDVNFFDKKLKEESEL